MRNKLRTSVTLGSLCALLTLGITACGPAVQPMNTTGTGVKGNPAATGTLVSPSGWLTIAASAQAGTGLQYYMERITSSLSQGSTHSDFSVSGAINPPDFASLSVHEGNTNTDYYQQGQVAYYLDNGRWSSTQALSDINVYPSFESIIREASQAGVDLYQQKKTYVVDEYCDVYTSVLPADMLSSLPDLGHGASTGNKGQVAVTWYVGQSDHVLRQVDMQSVGGVTDIGEMEVNTSVLMYDINSPYAKVTIPKSLEQQLENVTG